MSADGLAMLRLPAHHGPASEASVNAYLRELGVEPAAWSNGAGDRYASHQHAYTKVLMCASGSITFMIDGAGAEPITLQPGEGFVLPPGARHAAEVGPGGVTCLEGRRG